jgi:subtilisin family serine protease
MSARRFFFCASALFLAVYGPAHADSVVEQATTYPTGGSAQWLAQIGVTNAIETQAKGGAGFKIGFVDTGVVATQMDLVGRVSTLSSCAAVTFVCSKGYTDDNGHGTATAAIGAGAALSSGAGMSGVAPSATIIAEKVLNASGSGYDIDVANGITKAVNAGAQLINLSLTYTPTQSVVNAINYAASKGVIIVYAGGNSAMALNGGTNSGGFTPAALKRLVFVGSVNSQNVLSSFSNTPGGGSAVAGATTASYASLWLDAPGERIYAPGIQYGATAFAYWSGTSMAAPMVAGALALLENTWPVLNRNGTATAVLFQSATDLGTTGLDNSYGNGLLNVTRAFQPIGALTVTTKSGQSVAVSSLTGTTLTSGALGSLSAIKPLLANYTTFDSFERNFVSNLSGLLAQIPTAKPSSATATSLTVVSGRRGLTDGRTLSFSARAGREFRQRRRFALWPRHRRLDDDDDRQYGVQRHGRSRLPGGRVVRDRAVGRGFGRRRRRLRAARHQRSDESRRGRPLHGRGLCARRTYARRLHAVRGGRAGLYPGDAWACPAGDRHRRRRNDTAGGRVDRRVDAQHARRTQRPARRGLYGEQRLRSRRRTPLDVDGAFLRRAAGEEHEPPVQRRRRLYTGRFGERPDRRHLAALCALLRHDAGAAERAGRERPPELRRHQAAARVRRFPEPRDDHGGFGRLRPYRHDARRHPPRSDETDFTVGYAKFWGDTTLAASFGYRQDADNLVRREDFVARVSTGVRF